MKGNQGLEALAALACEGVVRGRNDQHTISPHNCHLPPAEVTPSAGATHPATSTPVHHHTASDILNAQRPPTLESLAAAAKGANPENAPPQHQWYQSLMAAACGGAVQQPLLSISNGYNQPQMSPNFGTGGAANSNAVQQLAFYHYYQAQMAAVAQAGQLAQQRRQVVDIANAAPLGSMLNPTLVAALGISSTGGGTGQSTQIHRSSMIETAPAPRVTYEKPQHALHVQTSSVIPVAPISNHKRQKRRSPEHHSSLAIETKCAPEPYRSMTTASPRSTPSSIMPSSIMPSPPLAPKVTSMIPQESMKLDGHSLDDDGDLSDGNSEDKKLQKRAANRRSAQLSRKRKKQFIEELKDENHELRRKELILMSIPDLIVVFDSTGRLWFVSQSVGRFLNFSPDELMGTCFWDRLCLESVRLLKAAFMDALAARRSGEDTSPLGDGFWELRLVDKDNSQQFVTLNGVVHLSGDTPECVCSIRPCGDINSSFHQGSGHVGKGHSMKSTVKPNQSVRKSEEFMDASSVIGMKGKVTVTPRRCIQVGPSQISDRESVLSETGSDES